MCVCDDGVFELEVIHVWRCVNIDCQLCNNEVFNEVQVVALKRSCV